MDKTTKANKKAYGMREFFQRYPQVAILIAYVVIIIAFYAASPDHFLTGSNITNIVNQTATVCILGFGMTLVLLIGGIDLSIGGIIAIVACSCSMMMDQGIEPGIAVFAGLALGLLFGFLNGIIIVKLKILPFLATLGIMNITRGLAKYITDGRTIVVSNDGFKAVFSAGSVGPIPILVFWIVAVLLIMFFLVSYTPFGRKVQAIGGNEEAAINSGIKVKTVKVAVYMTNGLLASLVGFIFMSRLGSAAGTNAQGAEMDAIAAAVLGGTGFNGEGGNMLGTLLGALVIGTVLNGMTIVGVNSFLQDVVKGIIIIATVAFSVAINRKPTD